MVRVSVGVEEEDELVEALVGGLEKAFGGKAGKALNGGVWIARREVEARCVCWKERGKRKGLDGTKYLYRLAIDAKCPQ